MTWWFARQLLAGDAVVGRSVDWQMEAAMADRIYTTQGEAAYQAINSVEDLISPSIHSGIERDCQAEDL